MKTRIAPHCHICLLAAIAVIGCNPRGPQPSAPTDPAQVTGDTGSEPPVATADTQPADPSGPAGAPPTSVPPASASASPGKACNPLSTTDGFASECLAEFCLDPSPIALVNPKGEPGFECTGCDEPKDMLLQFSYRNEDRSAHVHLRFDKKKLAGRYSTENFTRSFDSAVATRVFRDKGQEVNNGITETHVKDLVYADGRLRGIAWIDPQHLLYSIESQHVDCITGDIVGMCWCSYEGQYPPLEIHFDLSIPGG